MKYFFLDGKFIKENEAKIKVNDLGLLRGYGVFDYLRTYNRIPFHLDDHLTRFFKSAKRINLKVPLTKREIEKIISQLIKKNKRAKELSFRIVLTGGETFDGKTSKKPSLFIITGKPHPYPKSVFEKGIKICTLIYHRQLPEIKSLNYILAIANWERVLRKGAQEILYVFGNQVFECSTSNFFIVKNGVLYTPRENILEGITEEITINLAKRAGFIVKKKNLFLRETLYSDEAFITATDKEIMPVVKIDNFKIGNGKVGKITKELMKVFKEYVVKNK